MIDSKAFKIGDKVLILKWDEPIPYTGVIAGFDLCTTSNINVLLDIPIIWGRSFWFCPCDLKKVEDASHYEH